MLISMFTRRTKPNTPPKLQNNSHATQLAYCTISADFLNVSQLSANKARAICITSSNLLFQYNTKSVLQTKSRPTF